jgi:hypothetical protein
MILLLIIMVNIFASYLVASDNLFTNKKEYTQLVLHSRRENDKKLCKIVYVEELVNTLVPYAKQQIKDDTVQLEENNQKMTKEKGMLSIDYISTENPKAWKEEGIEPVFANVNSDVFRYLSCIEPSLVTFNDTEVTLWDKSKIKDYLIEETDTWDWAREKALNLDQPLKTELRSDTVK